MPYPNFEGGDSTGEFAAIERLRRMLPPPQGAETWIGDDAAVVEVREGMLLLSTDLSVSGVHLDLSLGDLADFGWKALSSAVSDIAAMGGRPGHALVAVAGPPDTDLALLYRGLVQSAHLHDCPIVGGDLSGADQLVVAVTVTGTVSGGPPAVSRSGARAGHELYVTGALGGSGAGLRLLRESARRGGPLHGAGSASDALVLRHLRPRARVAEGETARLAGASAMIDVSDGLASDVGHLADASAVGVVLDSLPVETGASDEEALGAGEDYELVIATGDGAALKRAFVEAGLSQPVLIGACVSDPSERSFKGVALEGGGYEHPWHF